MAIQFEVLRIVLELYWTLDASVKLGEVWHAYQGIYECLLWVYSGETVGGGMHSKIVHTLRDRVQSMRTYTKRVHTLKEDSLSVCPLCECMPSLIVPSLSVWTIFECIPPWLSPLSICPLWSVCLLSLSVYRLLRYSETCVLRPLWWETTCHMRPLW